MEAIHSLDLMLFHCSSLSPIPQIFPSADKNECTNVNSEMINRDMEMQEAEHITEAADTPIVRVSAYDERRLQIQNVRKRLPVGVLLMLNTIDLQTFLFCLTYLGSGKIFLFSFSADLSFNSHNLNIQHS